jgi:hypothetical protein
MLRRAIFPALLPVWLGVQPFEAIAQAGGVTSTPFDSQHCPPIACSAGEVVPEGCSCLAGDEFKKPPPLPAPDGCDPQKIADQLSGKNEGVLGGIKGTIKLVTAPPSCQITPDQCEALPNRKTVTLSDGSTICQPKTCSKDCFKFGGTDIGPFHFGGIDFCSTCLSLPVKPVNSVDPNSKQGSLGATDAQFVRGDTPLSYTIHFENLATATAPAQVVVVTDQLDPQKVDVDSVRLGPIVFGTDTALAPAPGVRGWTGSVDLRPVQNLIVAISAGIDRSTGVVTWRFISVDPATEQLTDDPLAGFLPPNLDPPAGEGSVAFSVMPKGGLATGTAIQNQAVVVFDTNVAIATPTWLNTIDRDPPVTHVLSLPTTQSSPTFPVQWSGIDGGSGIGAFTILVSDNGGPFTVWLDSVAGSSAMYAGQIGHSYAFMSLGVDLVGNVEPLKTVADATTQIASAPACATDVGAQVQVTRSGYGYNFATQRFVQTITLKNISGSTFASPISLVLDHLSSNATLYNPTGTTACATPSGSPFINWLSSLAPGASASIVLQFTNPTKAGITYATRVLAGSGGR